MRRIGILIFDEAEELDFAGPLEVFGVAERLRPGIFEIFTVSRSGREVGAVRGLRVRPDYSFRSCPKIDVLVVPGGRGARREMRNRQTLEFIRKRAKDAELVASVCTGALVLAAAGLLDGKRATTHWAGMKELREFPRSGWNIEDTFVGEE